MKIIIAYASAGAGHVKAAEALYNYFKEENPYLELMLVDVLKQTNKVFRTSYVEGYDFLISHAQWLWRTAYWVTSLKRFQPLIQGVHSISERLYVKKFARFLVKEQPDVVVCTHFLPAEITSYLKKKKKIRPRIVTVITDFGLHPFWLHRRTNIYSVASERSKEKLLEARIPKGKIRVTGIPVDPKFLRDFDKLELCEKFGIDSRRFTVLVATGSFGIGPIEPIVKSLHSDVQMLVVCAKNKKLFARLKRKRYQGVKVFGFIDNIEELMAVSDIIITKPGGLSISELLVRELVPIFISVIPGQETENVKALEEYGVGINLDDPQGIRKAVLDYKRHPHKMERAKNIIRQIKKPDAAKEIYRVIC